MSSMTTNPIQPSESGELFYLFGASKPWHAPHWRTTDDRLRGGASQSFLTPLPNNTVRFHGTLDIKTLGGAGFASQFSPSPSSSSFPAPTAVEEQDGYYNLLPYPGISLSYTQGDGKTYTLILKDSTPVPPSLSSSPSDDTKRADGRERAGISWEVNFTAAGQDGGTVFFPWEEFKATFRGREVDLGPGVGVERGEVRRVGVMCRSGFGLQEGGFGVVLGWIGAGRVGEKGEGEGEL